MKFIIRFLLVLAVFCLVSNSASAQHWIDSTVAVPEGIFPIGGIPFGLGDFHDSVNSLKEAGFNMDYERDGDYGGAANIAAMTHGLVGYMSMWYALTPYIGSYNEYFPGSERRYFLSSNETGVYAECDTVNTWVNKVGSRNANHEWFVQDTMGISGNTDYTLTGLQVYAKSLEAHLGEYIVWPQTDSAFCDFIFRIDTVGKNSSTWDDARYSVEYYLIDKDSNVQTYFDTITINKQLAFLQAPNRDLIEHKHILMFPDTTQKVLSALQTEYYARIRQVLPIHIGSFQAKTVEVKLRTFHNANIFVRGLRIRSHLAEEVLSGQKDSTLDTLFRKVRDSMTTLGIFDQTPFITAGGETQTPNFRVYSYIDDLCKKQIGKHIVMFLASDGAFIKYPWYRTIYEDQTDSIPPPLQAECAATFWSHDVGTLLPIPRDCIPDSIFSVPHFTMFGAEVLPPVDSNYEYYTRIFQYRSGSCSKLLSAQTAYPPGKTPGKWYGMISGLYGFNHSAVDMS
ncbi:MAG: hypothetical protein ABI778_04850, partial [Ignavibacteriota bacterium]